MGYSKANRVTELTITLKYPKLGREHTFKLPRARKMDKDKRDQLIAIGNEDVDIAEWAASILIAPPTGFDDFPMTAQERANGKPLDLGPDYVESVTSSLEDRVRAYFRDPNCPELSDTLYDLWGAYYRATTPDVFFPSSASSPATSHST